MQKLAYRDEAIALLLQLGKGFLQRFHGLRAVAAAVVHEDDASRLRLHDAARDGVRSRAPPVFGVNVPSDLGIDVGLQRPNDIALEVATRRAHDAGGVFADGVLDCLKALLNLLNLLVRGHIREIHALAAASSVVPRVRADLVALVVRTFHHVGVIGNLVADGEERRVRVILLQDVEDLFRRALPWAVVEGKRNHLVVAGVCGVNLVLLVHRGGRILGHGLAGNLAGLRRAHAVLAVDVHMQRAVPVIVVLDALVGNLLGGRIVVLRDVGAVLDVNGIALPDLLRSVVGGVPVDGRGKAVAAALGDNARVNGEQVACRRGGKSVVDEFVDRRSVGDGVFCSVYGDVESGRVQNEERADADGDDKDCYNADGNRAGAFRAALGVAGVIVVDGGVGRVVSVRLRARTIIRRGPHVPLGCGSIRC